MRQKNSISYKQYRYLREILSKHNNYFKSRKNFHDEIANLLRLKIIFLVFFNQSFFLKNIS